jgi:hypothetical protein
LKVCITFVLLAAMGRAAPCPERHRFASGDTLPALALRYFGDAGFAPAILMATNSRTGDGGFSFISNPDVLAADVCIPDKAEALKSRAGVETYRRAVATMSVAHPWELANADLVRIPYGETVTVTQWTRASTAASYQTGVPQTAQQDIWVTVEPHLRDFCRAFAKDHPGNEELLAERLEQRLGLPPGYGDAVFQRIRLANPSPRTIFRPCSNPATDQALCEAGPPDEKKSPDYALWFYRQYYSVYGLPRPSLYPWTSLGYTFDWAPKPDGDFVRVGESEFVIPQGATFEVLGKVSTAEYCR